MRLKEPLFGLRIANMHILWHLGATICMIFSQIDLSDMQFRDFRLGKKSRIYGLDPAEAMFIKKRDRYYDYIRENSISNFSDEYWVFFFVFFTHIGCLVLNLVAWCFTKSQWTLTGNMIKNSLIPLVWILAMIFCIFVSKASYLFGKVNEEGSEMQRVYLWHSKSDEIE